MTEQSSTTENRQIPREWRNTICEYANERCVGAKSYGRFNNLCSIEKGYLCRRRDFLEILSIFDELEDFQL